MIINTVIVIGGFAIAPHGLMNAFSEFLCDRFRSAAIWKQVVLRVFYNNIEVLSSFLSFLLLHRGTCGFDSAITPF